MPVLLRGSISMQYLTEIQEEMGKGFSMARV